MATDSKTTIKFLCSYGGKLVPRYPDGNLRYHGGHTRVLAVHRSISFSELLTKLGELCGGATVNLRCQLPPEADLDDALVTIVSDEDLANLIEEYDRTVKSIPSSSSLKIRAFLSLPPKKQSSPPSSSSSSSSSSTSSTSSSNTFAATVDSPRCYRRRIPPRAPAGRKFAPPPHHCGHHVYLIHNGNHWQ